MDNSLNKKKLFQKYLFISTFPIFGITESDNTNMSAFEINNLTIIIRIIYIFICGFCLLNSNAYWPKFKNVNKKFIFLYILYILGFLFPILYNEGLNFKIWIKFLEILIISFLSFISIYNLDKYSPIYLNNEHFYKIIYLQFWIILCIMSIVAVINNNVVLHNSELRGLRLGGSFIHPNTLSLGIVCFIIASFELYNRNRIKLNWFIITYIISTILLVGTKSSSGILIYIITTIFIIYRVGSKNLKYFYVTALILIIPFCVVVLWNYSFKSLIAENGTWADRTIIYTYSLSGINEHLMMGVGPFDAVKNYFSIVNIFGYFIPAHTHNLILEALLSRGVIFAVPLIIVLSRLFVKSISEIVDHRNTSLITGYSIMFVIIIVHGMVESSFFGSFKPYCHVYLIITAHYIYTGVKKKKKFRK